MFPNFGNFKQKTFVKGLLLFACIHFVHTINQTEYCKVTLQQNRRWLYKQDCNSPNYNKPIPSSVKVKEAIKVPPGCTSYAVCDNGYGLIETYNLTAKKNFDLYTYSSEPCYDECRRSVSCKIGFPECKKTCPKLRTIGLNLVLECSLDGEKRPCTRVHFNGTIVRIRCMKYHHQEIPATYNQIRCMENGEWSNPLFKCVLDCGKAISSGSSETKLLPSGLELANSPWYAIMYNRLKERIISSGIIISERIVMTNGYEGGLLNEIDSSEVIIGENVRRLIYENETETEGKTYTVKEIRAESLIILLILHENIQMNKFVLPICIDYGKETSNYRLTEGSVAKIFIFWRHTRSYIKDYYGPLMVTNANVTIYNSKDPKDDNILGNLIKYNNNPRNDRNEMSATWGQGLLFYHPRSNFYFLQGILTQFHEKNSYFGPYHGSPDIQFVNITSHINWIKKINEEIEHEKIGVVLECGKIFVSHKPQVHGGAKDIFGASPWQVALYRTVNKETILICGGTIIAKRVILSAAHCFFGSSNPTTIDTKSYEIVVAKTSRDFKTRDNESQKVYKIKEVIYPNTYHGVQTYYTSDIALIVLQENIKFSAVVRPACTEFSTEDAFLLETGNMGKVAGWGVTESGKPSDTLLTANVSYIDHAACTGTLPPEIWDSITVDKFCAQNENGSVVDEGDSGGGLVFLHPHYKQYYVRGIVSTKLGEESSVAIYTDVGFHNKWIQRTLQNIR